MANANTKRIPWKSLQIEKELSVHTLDMRVRARPRSLPSSDIGEGSVGYVYRQTDKMIDKSLDNMGEVFTEGREKFRRFEILDEAPRRSAWENTCTIMMRIRYITLYYLTRELSSRSDNYFLRKNFLISVNVVFQFVMHSHRNRKHKLNSFSQMFILYCIVDNWR